MHDQAASPRDPAASWTTRPSDRAASPIPLSTAPRTRRHHCATWPPVRSRAQHHLTRPLAASRIPRIQHHREGRRLTVDLVVADLSQDLRQTYARPEPGSRSGLRSDPSPDVGLGTGRQHLHGQVPSTGLPSDLRRHLCPDPGAGVSRDGTGRVGRWSAPNSHRAATRSRPPVTSRDSRLANPSDRLTAGFGSPGRDGEVRATIPPLGVVVAVHQPPANQRPITDESPTKQRHDVDPITDRITDRSDVRDADPIDVTTGQVCPRNGDHQQEQHPAWSGNGAGAGRGARLLVMGASGPGAPAGRACVGRGGAGQISAGQGDRNAAVRPLTR